MENTWEVRERKSKRIALIVSLLLHVAALAAIGSAFGKHSFHNLIEHVFSSQDIAHADSTKV